MKSMAPTVIGIPLVCIAVALFISPAHAQWALVWQDEFNGAALDQAKWTAVNNCGDKRNNEQQCYMASAVSLDSGQLIITGTKTPQGSFAFTSGAIKTGTKYTVAYGKIEFRAKMPVGGQGVWPALWLYPPNQWPPEIDVLEAINDMSRIYFTYHWGTASTHQQNGGNATITDPGDWHLYAAEWDTGEVRWYIDGALKRTFTNAAVTSIPMQLYINLALGGSWPGSVGTATVFPQVMRVDYVRVYKRSVSAAAPSGREKNPIRAGCLVPALCRSGIQVASPRTGAWDIRGRALGSSAPRPVSSGRTVAPPAS